MSRGASVVLLGSMAFLVGAIWFVHENEVQERKVPPRFGRLVVWFMKITIGSYRRSTDAAAAARRRCVRACCMTSRRTSTS